MALDMQNMGGLVALGQDALMGEDTMQGALGMDGAMGTGIKSGDYQIPVSRPQVSGGLGQAGPNSVSSAKQDYLKATQDMITALEQRISNQGYDVSRLLFAFGQPTSTGSIGSALGNVGLEASRQRGEQEKNLPTMMKMRTDLAANRLAMAQQEEAERIANMLGIGAPGANVQAAPGSGASAEAAVGNPQVRRLMAMDPEQLLAMTRPLGPAGEQLYRQVMQAREDYRKNFLPGGDGSFFRPDTGQRIYNPAELAKPIERQLNLGNANIDIKMPLGDWMKYDEIMDKGGQAEAAKFIVGKIPSLGPRIGAIAPPREMAGQPVAPVQSSAPPVQSSAPPVQAPAQAPAQGLPGVATQPSAQRRQFESESEKRERLEIEKEQRQQAAKIAEKQAGEDISMLGAEVKDARAPILTRYDKADAVLQEAKQMMQLASTYPYAVGIFAKPGGQYALGQFIKEGIRAGGVNVQIGDFEGAMRRLVRANPEMVARVAKERGISTSQAENYLQQQGLDAASLLLQSERRLDALLNKAERKGEGQVSNYERVLFAQLLPSLSNDPIKAYLFKTIALQEQAKFDKQVGDLLRKRSESKQYDPRQMYDSKEYIQLRTNYVNALEGSMREFFPETKARLAQARKTAGV